MTFRIRLTLAYLLLLAVALSAFGLGVYIYVERKLHHEFERSVQTEGKQLAQAMSIYEDETRLRQKLGDAPSVPGSYIVVQTRRPGGQLKDIYNPANASLPVLPPGRVVFRVTPRLGRLALYAENFTGQSQSKLIGNPAEGQRQSRQRPPQFTGRVTVARSLEDVDRSLRPLRTILVAGGLAVLLVGALLSLGLAAALLRPLGRMRATAQRIGDERDFTRRMRVEGNPHDELGRLSSSFNQMLAELERSNIDLKTTLEAQRRFVADASHELRTPLTAIRTNVEFLSRVPDARTEDRAGALQDVLAELRRMESLVGDLLALARLEAASRAARRPFRLDHLLVDVHRDALRLAPEGVEVGLGALTELWVSGERDDLRRAVWNLVDNALKYTPVGRVDLRLASHDGVAELAVADTGVGIAEAHLEHVFDRFWRAPGMRGTAGSGLGLAITRWVAQAHGGTVTVASTPGSGTTFTLTLPVLKGRKAARQAARPERELLGHSAGKRA
jgi:two-component system OmpR family sensor kinase